MPKIVIIGGGLAGLECARSLVSQNITDFVVIEKNASIAKPNSWKTFPDVVTRFGLSDCIATTIDRIFFRTCDIPTATIITSNSPTVPCVVLKSDLVYAKYERELTQYIVSNRTVTNIYIRKHSDNTKEYVVVASGQEFPCDIIVDASGANSVVDRLTSNTKFTQSAYYLCYAKRYTHCKTLLMRHDAFFDFDTPFKACGCWCYPIDDTTVEIGVARFTAKYGIDDALQAELESQIEDYKRLSPFNEVFADAIPVTPVTPIYGFCPLLPRTTLMENNIYHIGDTKGAVPYSGYGIENALASGRSAAESIATHQPYRYFITPPSQGLGILNLLWQLTPEQLRTLSTGISELSITDVTKFFTGHTDLMFFLRANRISAKRHLKLIGLLPKGMIWRILFGRLPKSADYGVWWDLTT